MRMFCKYIYCIGFLSCTTIITACNFIEIDAPKDRIITTTLFEDEATANAAILGLYSRLARGTTTFSNAGTTILMGLASDELETNITADIYQQFFNNDLAIDNDLVTRNFWQDAYTIIYQANSCISGIEKSNSLSIEFRNKQLGEAYFIRAFCYWYLVNLFGDVPLIISPDYEENAIKARSSVVEVKRTILTDLLTARQLLSAPTSLTNKFRVSHYAVSALLARFYLYEKNWEEVEKYTTEIIESELYQYEANLNDVFLRDSQEAIWQLRTEDDALSNAIEGQLFNPTTAATTRPNYFLTDHLLNAFESGDLRRANWVTSKTVAGITYHYPFKYKVRQNTVKTEYYAMFRITEAHLNRAEARANLNQPDLALDDLNIIRRRAGLAELSTENTTDVLGAIYKERRIELFAEWGNRWFDLKRTGTIDQVLSAVKPNYTSTDHLFPIPEREIRANPNLTQNPGYPN